VSTNGAYPDEMNEVALFTDALRAAVPTRPDPGLGTSLVPRLAEVARAATIEAETQTTRRRPDLPARRRPRSRRVLVARVAIAVGLIPLVLAGLAFAGVTVPAPARDAFDSVGITLPNQPSKQSQKPDATNGKASGGEGSGNEVSNAAQTKAKGKGGNSAAAHEHARKQHEKAHGKAKGHGRGKAVGLNESTPPGHSGQTGPPAHSNAGGSSSSHSSSKAAPHTPNGVAKGQSKIPPGHSK
jgi:cell division protein FtsN